MLAKVLLKPRRAKPFWYGEPWVFDGSIDRIKGKPRLEDGIVVELCDDSGAPIGRGFWSGRSPIRVRLLALAGDDRPVEEIVRARLDAALALRVDVLGLDRKATAYRLVHAEGDGLPGLVVDRMADYLVVQFETAGMKRLAPLILDHLSRAVRPRGIVERVSRAAREQEGLEGEDAVVAGEVPDDEIEIEENGIRYGVDLLKGQKTGFYTDQRENRLFVAGLVANRRVLDAFSYTGAFGLNALKHGGAASVTAIDSSQPALDALLANLERNDLGPIEAIRGNVLRVLDHAAKDPERRWDVVLLDPPKLVPKKSDLRRGLKLYREIVEKGLAVLAPGGILATSSCSGAVTRDDLAGVIAEAAMNGGRRLQLLHEAGQGADHPMLVPHETSRYLKFLVHRDHVT